MRKLLLPLLIFMALGHANIVEAQTNASRPNILFIVGDDIGFGDLGISGSVTQTPNLDRLAKRGTFFTNFHVSPVCSVSRSMMLTGNNPIEVGLAAFDYAIYPPAEGKPGYEAHLTRTTATIAEILQNAGYRTYTVGKWHLGGPGHGGEGPEQWGFDRSYGIYTGGANHWNQDPFHINTRDPEVMAQIRRGEIPQEPYHEDGKPAKRPMGIYSDDLWTSKLMEYLEEGRETGKPFFAFVAYTTAHVPLQAPDFLIDKYYERYLELGFEGLHRARFESQKKMGIIPPDAAYPERASNPLLRAWSEMDDQEKRLQARTMATYSAMMESQDYHIGMLLNYLKETGQLDNTLIIYAPDNGPEGTDFRGELSNAAFTKWARATFSQKFDDIGRGNSMVFLGTDWAGAANGSLQWWKWFIGEGGIRVPLIVVPPKNTEFHRSGEGTDAYAYVKELPMTILDYAGVDHPQTEFKGRTITPPSGVSLRPFLAGEEPSPRTEEEWVAFELFGNAYVVAGDYKAMRVRPGMYGDGKWHLYDIKKDPGETRPLEADQPERLKKMIATYERYAKEKGIVPVADDWNPWHDT
ncbi:MAG: arylsulfatase [Deltaproteobacteria bacterium]|nr:arylsulfatase [Deltaproteobacteria bacterium]